jgi:hypothetical protein
MTKTFSDTIKVTLLIDNQPWNVVEAKVERSRMDTPDYVDLLMIPDPEETAPNLPSKIDSLIGAPFRLEADNDIVSERANNFEEDNLLFSGNLANISATGENSFEAIAYDPGQQAFAGSAAAGGSIMNDLIFLGEPEYSFQANTRTVSPGGVPATVFETQTVESTELARQIVDKIGLEKAEIEMEEGGIPIDGDEGSERVAFKRTLFFNDTFITVKEALNTLRESCDVEWFFDKEGVFHVGPPRPTKHELKFIIDTSAGRATPPYQSVQVIGSGAASIENFSRAHLFIEDKIVVEASLAIDEETGDPIANFGETKEPIFKYRNLEISSQEQAESTAKKLIEDIAEQQSSGKITVVGFPEIVPFDGVVMPSGKDGDYPDTDIRASQPMGGFAFGVYKVTHFLNNSDGFITELEVSSPIGVTATEVSSAQANTSYDVEAFASSKIESVLAGQGRSL